MGEREWGVKKVVKGTTGRGGLQEIYGINGC